MQQFIALTFRFSREELTAFNALVKHGHFPNREETVHEALAFLEWCLGQTASGAKLCLETQEGVAPIVFPYWEVAQVATPSEGSTAEPVAQPQEPDETFLKAWRLKMPDHQDEDET